VENEVGTVAAGRRADLVLLDANPLENVSHWGRRAGVMVRGRWYDAAEIQRRLTDLAKK
jgi:imidazolonepropionase-like amidohydrolase